MTRGATIRLSSVERRYGGVHAVRGVSLDVAAGEFLTLLGSSGCGKTTILMLIAGFDTPSAGEILIDGKATTHVPPHLRDQGFVFQHYALFPHMTVRQNLAFPLEIRGVAASERAARIERMVDRFGLQGLADRLPAQLSGGQQQRTALARALIHDPPLLLMDEPLAALDRNLRAQLQQEIKGIHREFKVTVIYVTHDQEEAMAMSDRIAVMNRGVLEQVASPEALYQQPASEFVARFMGEMNILECSVTADERPLLTTGEGLSMPAPESVPDLKPGARLKVAIRPEGLRLAATRDANAAHWAEAVVAKRIYLGDTEKYSLTVGRHTLVARQHVRAGVQRFNEGDRVIVGWNDADIGFVRGDPKG